MHTGTILLLHPVVGSNYHSNEIRISPDPRGLTRRAQLLAANMEEIWVRKRIDGEQERAWLCCCTAINDDAVQFRPQRPVKNKKGVRQRKIKKKKIKFCDLLKNKMVTTTTRPWFGSQMERPLEVASATGRTDTDSRTDDENKFTFCQRDDNSDYC